jgi:hypothetical protein
MCLAHYRRAGTRGVRTHAHGRLHDDASALDVDSSEKAVESTEVRHLAVALELAHHAVVNLGG